MVLVVLLEPAGKFKIFLNIKKLLLRLYSQISFQIFNN